ncbi:cytochrome P450 [Actinoplanes sp. L3-i22]|uniref:cytochrome P450 n=1 Tax=Actinoplanes sp. L3-i22 TaxID=2836373 RepID=UPI001C786422|nr:cytochrome P450 [Actinoplanes sp. L3-i22]BCY10845.1 cytochrome P450 [Actinoplanes sp. L3-i22]
METIPDPFFDPLSADVIADPHVAYRRLRDRDPVYWHAQLDSWVITGYEQCRQVLGDVAAFGSDFRRVGADVPPAHLSVQSLDPPEHGPIRHLLVTALREQPPAALNRDVAAIVADRLAALPRDGAVVDLVPAFARPVARATIERFLGGELPDGPEFEKLSNAIVRSMDAGLAPDRAGPGAAARAELSAMIEKWLADPPENGFLGAVRRAKEDVSEAVVANSLRTVLHAGYESVSRLIGNALGRLARDGLRADPGLADELVRLDGPVQADARVCVRETRVGAHVVREGQILIVMLAAANRDPAVFPDPDRVDGGRARGVHLGFGRGAHACLGAALGLRQLQEVLRALRDGGITLVPAGPPRLDRTATLRGFSSLPVRLA